MRIGSLTPSERRLPATTLQPPSDRLTKSDLKTPRRRETVDIDDLIIDIEQMRSREFLGQHELMVMLAVLRLGRQAYGVPIAAEIAEKTGREMLQGSVYAILDRLEAKGLITSRLGEATPERGGRAKRYFELTAEGVKEVREAQRALESLWRNLPKTAGAKP